MPRPSINETPMTGAERQARYRAMRAAGAPIIRTRHPTDRRSRIQRWNDTIAAAVELQAEYAGWLDALPENQQDSALAEALRAIEQRDGPDGIGHDDARAGFRTFARGRTHASMPG